MNNVKFKTLDAESVHRKLTAVGDRLLCVETIIDRILNDTDTSYLIPVLQDAQSELGEVFFDMTEWKDSKLAIIGD